MLSRKEVIRRKLATWRGFTLSEKALYLPAFLALGLARLAILLVPFRRLAPWLGRHAGNRVFVPLGTPLQETRARSIGRVVRSAARYAPWRALCFEQALVASVFMRFRRVPHAIYFGVAKDASGQLNAHAWTSSGKIRVTGGESFGRFTVLSTFVFPPSENADLLTTGSR